jgi:chemotaxis protein methyltransferase CheR
MDDRSVERIEIDLLLEALYRRYGYDFRHYARASIRRRIRHFSGRNGGQSISEVIPPLFADRVP